MLVYPGVNIAQVLLSGFSVRLLCFVNAKTVCMYGCTYFFSALVFVSEDEILMSSA